MNNESPQQRHDGNECEQSASLNPSTGQPEDWPFQTLKLGEYFSYARQAARHVCEHRIGFAQAVEIVLCGQEITDRERRMLEQKVQSIVYLGLENE